MEFNAAIGSRIAKLRKERGMTQEQLAERLDISIKHCSAVERGISSLSLEKLVDVSMLFDVTLDFLVKDNSLNTASIEYFLTRLPHSIASILTSQNEEEMELLLEYLRLYAKIRSKSEHNGRKQVATTK